MHLSDVMTLLVQETTLEPVTRGQYTRALERLDAYLGRRATVDDLTPDQINPYLLWLTSTYSLGAVTVRNYRSGIIRIWNYCTDPLGIAGPCPTRRIRRPKTPPKVVRAWTLDDLAILLDAAATMPGQLRCGIPASVFLVAWLWIGYESGFRPSDMRPLDWRSIDFASRTITIVQHKTGKMHTSNFGAESDAALLALRAYGHDKVFPVDKSGVTRWEKLLYQRAGRNGFCRIRGQGIGTLRKTHATEIYRQYGLAAAAESLGHKGGVTTARNHYVDSRLSTGHLPPSPARRA